MEKNSVEQIIKGDGNTQSSTSITVHGDYVVGLQREEVLEMIKNYCQVDKDQLIKIVSEQINLIHENNRRTPDKSVCSSFAAIII